MAGLLYYKDEITGGGEVGVGEWKVRGMVRAFRDSCTCQVKKRLHS